MSSEVHIKKKQELWEQPAASSVAPMEWLADLLVDNSPGAPHLGRSIELLAFKQNKASVDLRALGSDYQNQYKWGVATTDEQRRKVAPVLSYSSFTWNKLLGDDEFSIDKAVASGFNANKNRLEAQPGFQLESEGETETPPDTELKTENYLLPDKAVVFDRSVTTNHYDFSGRSLKPYRDLQAKSISDSPPSDSDETLTAARYLKRTKRQSALRISAPGGDATDTTLISPVSSNHGSYSSPSGFTPPRPIYKPHLPTGAADDQQQLTGLGHDGPVSHLGDGITQVKPCNFNSIRVSIRDVDSATTVKPFLVHVKNSSLLVHPAAGSDHEVVTRKKPKSAAPVQKDSPGSSIGTSSTASSEPNLYPISRYQPWEGMTCYDVPWTGSSNELRPLYMTSEADKRKFLAHKNAPLSLMDHDLTLSLSTASVATAPIHIFIDLSNIIIGFYDCMKMKRGIPVQRKVRAPAFSFGNFHQLLARGREVAKKVIAGSLSSNPGAKIPEYMPKAESLGYEMNILQRVTRTVPLRAGNTRRSFGPFTGDSSTSGPESSGDDSRPYLSKQGEQGVDEVLHLKILQSVVDCRHPGTIVLATGDGARAEYSDGFKAHMERALVSGWHVELYSWSHNLSSEWKSSTFTKKWGDKFRVTTLDSCAEELYDACLRQ